MTGYLIGLDIGDVRVGVAKSDPLGMIASPLPFVPFYQLIPYLQKLPSDCKGLVIGVPYNLKGETEQKARFVLDVIEKIKAAIPTLPVYTVDERFTTRIAEQKLIASGTTRKKRQEKGLVDSWAAVEILQSWLDKK